MSSDEAIIEEVIKYYIVEMGYKDFKAFQFNNPYLSESLPFKLLEAIQKARASERAKIKAEIEEDIKAVQNIDRDSEVTSEEQEYALGILYMISNRLNAEELGGAS